MKQLNIAVGIIANSQRKIFITRRGDDAHMAGKWEFPGGKIEAGESAEQALVRELEEEVGITAGQYYLFDRLEHSFSDRHITLFFFMVTGWQGEPFGKEGQPGHWVAINALLAEDFPPANAPIIARLQS